VLDKAAQNEGGLGDTMGAGMGLGLGFGMGNQMGNMTSHMNTGQHEKHQHTGGTSSPPPPNSVQYFVLINNQQNGPHSIDSIKSLISQNQINRDTLVWKEGMAEWGKITDQIELKGLFGSVPPPPPTST
jgi:hypothetical protein